METVHGQRLLWLSVSAFPDHEPTMPHEIHVAKRKVEAKAANLESAKVDERYLAAVGQKAKVRRGGVGVAWRCGVGARTHVSLAVPPLSCRPSCGGLVLHLVRLSSAPARTHLPSLAPHHARRVLRAQKVMVKRQSTLSGSAFAAMLAGGDSMAVAKADLEADIYMGVRDMKVAQRNG